MAEFYKILKADPLGDPWTPSQPGAKPIQNYWCQVEGQDWDVSIGKQVGNTLVPGQHVYGDLTYAKSQKGTEYFKFKGQKIPDDVQRPADSPAQSQAQQAVGISGDTAPGWFHPYGSMIRFIYDEMKKMSDQPDHQIDGVGAKPKPEEVKEDPLDQETKAQLDEIFNTPDVSVDEVPEGE